MAGFQTQSGGVEKIRGLIAWCKETTRGYANVNVTNMTSSWKDGLAFCAIIHRFRPDLINYTALKSGDVLENNGLAFSVAEEELGIPALLDPEDMAQMAVPDRLCVITYVSQLHAHFKNCQPDDGLVTPGKKEAIGRNWRDKAGLKRPSAIPFLPPSKKRGTLEDICTICRKKVYILERSLVEGKLYHRVCYKESVNKKDGDGDSKKSSTRKSSVGAIPETGVGLIPEDGVASSKVDLSKRSSKRSSRASFSSSSPSSSLTTRESKSPSSSPRRLSKSKSPSRTSSAAKESSTPTSGVVEGSVATPQRPRAAPRLTTTKFLEEDNDKKKPPIPAARATLVKKSDEEDSMLTSSPSLDPSSTTSSVAPTARAVGARINRLMAEQNNNEFRIEIKPRAVEGSGPLSHVSRHLDDRSKYLGLDGDDRPVTSASPSKPEPRETSKPEPRGTSSSSAESIDKEEDVKFPNLKPIPALRRIESEKIKEGEEEEEEENVVWSNSRLSSSKVVSKGTLERKATGSTSTTGKPTLFVKPMIKPQIAQHRRLYLAHFDVDGNVDVQTGDNRNGDSRITEGLSASPRDSSAVPNSQDSSSANPANSENDEVPTKPSPAKRSTVITATPSQPPTTSALPSSLRKTIASTTPSSNSSTPVSSPSSTRRQGAEHKKQLKIILPEPESLSNEKSEKLSPSNPFFEGEEEEGKEVEKKESDKTREEEVLTPTNPFSDGFDDDEDPLVKGVQISSDGPNASSVIGSKASIESRIATSDEGISSSTDSIGGTPKKCPPSKPPRILLRADTEMREDDAISDTHSPKRILSVDKSLLADLKVPLHGSERKSRVSSISGEDVSKSSRNSSPSSVLGSESGSSPARRKTKRKAPPPPSEFLARVIRSASVTIALDAIEKELQSIDEEQQDLEEKGVALETKLRAEDAEEDEAAMEAVWAEWFQLINRKNELFRREMELYHTRRMQELEDKHSEVERDIRILGNIPSVKKTPKDLEREEWLIGELIAIVNERNKVVDAVEMDRQREKAEDESIELMRGRRLTIAANHQNKAADFKEKKTKEEKKREKKEKKKAEKERKKGEKETNKPSKGFGHSFRRKVLADQ